MKRIVQLLILLFSTLGLAQVGVNTTTPDPSSMLDISATNKGVLVPRVSLANVTTTQLDGTNTAATGLLIWNTNAATIGGNGVGFYFFNGTQWMPITQTATSDHDWYEVGGTNPPNAITDAIYHTGDVGIGKTTASYALDISELDNAKIYGVAVSKTENSGAETAGIYISKNTNGAGVGNNILNNIASLNINNQTTGVKNTFSGVANLFNIGFHNQFQTTSQYQRGFFNEFTNVAQEQIGLTNQFGNVTGALNSTGVSNFWASSNTVNAAMYGIKNNLESNGNGERYGSYSYISGTGTGNRYGSFNQIATTAGGQHFGVYSNVLKSGSFAGYFLGNVSIGTTTTNNYILPPSRGTNGQIMQTDGSGNVSWVNPVVDTDTDDQTTDVFNLTGTTLNLSLQNDGVATQTVDLSSLKDADWFEVGGTNAPDTILDNKYTLGDISIGKITAANGKLDVDAALKNITTSFTNNNATAGSKYGIQNNVIVGTNNNLSFGISNAVTGSADSKYGIYNTLAGAVTGGTVEYGLVNSHLSSGSANGFGVFNLFSPLASHTGNYTGLYNEISGTNHIGGFLGVNNIAGYASNSAIYGINNTLGGSGSGVRLGVYNNMSGNSSGEVIGTETFMTATGTGNKFGERITIANTSPGTHYGIYSDVTKAGSFAGYFLGNVSVGTNIANNYVLPPSRGLNGQIMQTDGTGNLSWVNPPTDTDDQTTDVFSLTGTTLNLSLQNDGVATQTIDLSSLDTDNQTIDVLSLTGDTLNISLQDDAVATQTLNLGAIDNQTTDVFSLTGTTLNLSLQNDGVATQTVDLSPLLGDDDWTDVGANIERQSGDVYIGDTSATNNNLYISNQIIDWDNVTYTIDPNGDSIMNEILFDDGSITDPSIRFSDINTGFFSPIVATTAYSANGVEAFRIHPSGDIAIGQTIDPNFKLSTSSLFGDNNVRIGNNDSNDNVIEVDHGGQLGNGIEVNTSSGYNLGSRSAISANNTYYPTTVDLSRFEASTFNLFGVKSIVTDNLPGTEYGVYSEALQTNGFAGYFLGRMSIGTTTTNNYILPASRGTNGQIMQTNATGTVSWVNQTVDTDNQQIDILSLTGDILNISLQDDAVATQTLNLSAIDNQATDVFSLTGTTLNLSLQNDGVATQTVDLSSLDTDNQTIDVLSLTGDTLNISLQDDAVATQTLNLGAIDNQGTDVFSLTGNTLNLSLQNDGVATQTVDLSPLSNDWKLTGNAGTLSGTNFIGTTDAQDLDFRVNNVVKIRLTQQGQLSFVNAGGSVFVGINAGDADDLTSNQNTFVGSTSGQFTTTGNLNTAIGHASLNANLTGQGNTGLGKSSLLTNTTGSNNTGLGRLADVAGTGFNNATAVGYNAVVSSSDKVRLGNTTVAVVEGQVPYTNPSDARFKFNVQENVPGLDFIKKLKPVTYNFDTKKFDEHLNRNRNKSEVANEDFSKSTAIVRTGFLAQDVEKICTDLGYNFDGLHIPDGSNPTDNYGIAYSQFIMPIVKAVQEQQVIIETQKMELEQLKLEITQLKKLEERLKALENKE